MVQHTKKNLKQPSQRNLFQVSWLFSDIFDVLTGRCTELIGGEYSGGIEYESYPFDLKYLGVLNVTAPPAPEADSN